MIDFDYWLKDFEIYEPEDGSMPRIVADIPKNLDGISHEDLAAPLDDSSRATVRRIVSKWVKTGEWSAYWYGMSRCPRTKLINDCLAECDKNADKHDPNTCCYSPQAIAEEIDFFLPKAFWCYRIRTMNGKKSTPAKTVVNPDWPSMIKKWSWMFPQATTERLRAEYANRRSARHSTSPYRRSATAR